MEYNNGNMYKGKQDIKLIMFSNSFTVNEYKII